MKNCAHCGKPIHLEPNFGAGLAWVTDDDSLCTPSLEVRGHEPELPIEYR